MRQRSQRNVGMLHSFQRRSRVRQDVIIRDLLSCKSALGAVSRGPQQWERPLFQDHYLASAPKVSSCPPRQRWSECFREGERARELETWCWVTPLTSFPQAGLAGRSVCLRVGSSFSPWSRFHSFLLLWAENNTDKQKKTKKSSWFSQDGAFRQSGQLGQTIIFSAQSGLLQTTTGMITLLPLQKLGAPNGNLWSVGNP